MAAEVIFVDEILAHILSFLGNLFPARSVNKQWREVCKISKPVLDVSSVGLALFSEDSLEKLAACFPAASGLNMSMEQCRQVEDKWLLKYTSCFRHITSLYILENGKMVTDDGMAVALQSCKLQALYVFGCGFGPLMLKCLHAKPLRTLTLNYVKTFDEAALIGFLGSLGAALLIRLDVKGCTQLSNATLDAIVKCCPAIQTVVIEGIPDKFGYTSVRALRQHCKELYCDWETVCNDGRRFP